MRQASSFTQHLKHAQQPVACHLDENTSTAKWRRLAPGTIERMGVRPRLAAHDAKVPRRTARWHGGDGQVVWNVLGILVVLHNL